MAADAAFYSAGNEAAAKAKGVKTVAVIDRHVLDQHTHVGDRCKRRYCRDDNSLVKGRDQSGHNCMMAPPAVRRHSSSGPPETLTASGCRWRGAGDWPLVAGLLA